MAHRNQAVSLSPIPRPATMLYLRRWLLSGAALLLAMAAAFPILAVDQTALRIADVKADPQVIFGEGQAADLEQARQSAVADLALKYKPIAMVGQTTGRSQHLEGDQAQMSSDFSNRVTLFSCLHLTGLERLEYQSGSQWRVLAYIQRDSLARSFQIRKDKIREHFNIAQAAAADGRIGQALKNLYRGCLLASAYPDTIHFPSRAGELSLVPDLALKDLLTRAIQNISVKPGVCCRDGEEVIAPLSFTYEGRPARELSFNYYSGPGTQYARVINGHGDVPLFDPPMYSTYNLSVNIEYVYATEMTDDPEIAELHRILELDVFDNVKKLQLTIPWNTARDTTQAAETEEALPAMATIGAPVGMPSMPVMTAPPSIPDLPLPRPSEAITVLNSRRDWGEFYEALEQYRKLGAVSFGKRIDFGDGKGCYVAIAEEGRIVDLVYFDGASYVNLGSGEKLQSLAEKYTGTRMIWIRDEGLEFSR